MKNLNTLFCFLFFLAQIPTGFGQYFEPLNGPNGIEVRGLGVDSFDNIFFTSYFHDLYFSPDNGETWQLRNKGLPDDVFLGNFFETSPQGDIYSIGNFSPDRNLVKLPFGSDTWEVIDLPNQISNPSSFDISPSGVLFFSRENELYASPNGGEDFLLLNDQISEFSKIFTFGNNYNYGIKSNVDSFPIIKFPDNGVELDSIQMDLIPFEKPISIIHFEPNRLVVLTNRDRIAYTSDFQNWSWSITNFDENDYMVNLYKSPDQHIYVEASKGVYRSTDKGASFQKLNGYLFNHTHGPTTPQLAFSSTGDLFFSKGYYFFNKSSDGGQTWEDLTLNFQKSVTQTIKKDWGGNLFAQTRNVTGIQKSANDGQSWVRKLANGEDPIKDISFGEDNFVFAITENKKVLISENNGATWENITPNQIEKGFSFIEVGPDQTIYVCESTKLWYTSDLGENWKVYDFGSYHCESLNFHPNGDLYLMNKNNLVKSSDQGENWEHVFKSNQNTGFNITIDGDIILTGEIYDPLGSDFSYSAIITDNGTKISPFETPLGYHYQINSDAKGNYVIAKSNSILFSMDKGETWIDLNEDKTITGFISHLFIDKEQFLYVGVRRDVIYKSTAPVCELLTSTNQLFSNKIGIKISPNPIESEAKIEINNSDFIEHTIKIFNLTGQLIQIAHDVNDSYSFKRNNEAPGIYFYQIETKNQILKTGKIIIN